MKGGEGGGEEEGREESMERVEVTRWYDVMAEK